MAFARATDDMVDWRRKETPEDVEDLAKARPTRGSTLPLTPSQLVTYKSAPCACANTILSAERRLSRLRQRPERPLPSCVPIVMDAPPLVVEFCS